MEPSVSAQASGEEVCSPTGLFVGEDVGKDDGVDVGSDIGFCVGVAIGIGVSSGWSGAKHPVITREYT
jgi:hypothetical protein